MKIRVHELKDELKQSFSSLSIFKKLKTCANMAHVWRLPKYAFTLELALS